MIYKLYLHDGLILAPHHLTTLARLWLISIEYKLLCSSNRDKEEHGYNPKFDLILGCKRWNGGFYKELRLILCKNWQS